MGRPKTIQSLGNGDISVRITVPAHLAEILRRAAEITGQPFEHELSMTLLSLKRYVAGYTTPIAWLPIEMQEAIEEKRADSVKTAKQRARETEDAEIAQIKFELLHVSKRTKSGYVGVYANGNGFRAMGQIPRGKLQVIGTFKTAELAAWQRYLWYVEHKIPYGELAEEMELHHKKFGAGEEDKLKAFAINLRRYELGDPIPNLSDDDVELAEKTRRAEEEFLRAKPASVPDVRLNPLPASVPDARSESAPAVSRTIVEPEQLVVDGTYAAITSPPTDSIAAFDSTQQTTPASVDDARRKPVVESADDPMTFLGVPRSKLAEAREDANRRGVMLGFDGGLPPDLKFDDEP